MGRRASGGEFLEQAKACVAKARTVEELRQAQAVVLPLELGLSLEQTAQAIGVSVGWACQLRTRFVRAGGVPDSGRARRGGRWHENMTHDEEAAFLAPFFEKAKVGGILVVGEIKQALDVRLGRTVALASAYNLLHRHDWRKLAPDKQHPKADLAAQADWKKTPCPSRGDRPSVAQPSTHPADVSGRGALRAHLGYPALWVPQARSAPVPGPGRARIHLRLCSGLGGRRSA